MDMLIGYCQAKCLIDPKKGVKLPGKNFLIELKECVNGLRECFAALKECSIGSEWGFLINCAVQKC
jgi:hypothetical protein